MKKIVFPISVLLIWVASTAAEELKPLPAPVSNNAVAGVKIRGQFLVYSFMGIGPQKSWNSVSNEAFALNTKYNNWTAIKPVPGSGRLGSVAVAANEQIFLFGGYVPDPNGAQSIVSDVAIYEPTALRWYRGAEMPTAVRDAIAGVYRDRYAYVVGGFGKSGPTNQVQVYDTVADKWLEGTPLVGAPVFGHAGAVVNDTIVYLAGAKRNAGSANPPYIPSDECWMGKIDHHDPKKIAWSKLPAQPGTARYRIAAGASDRDQRIYFVGGSHAIYDFNGIGLDSKPGEPSPLVFAFDLKSNKWETIQENAPNPTMDHRGLAVASDGLIVVGGMAQGQKVVATTVLLPKKK